MKNNLKKLSVLFMVVAVFAITAVTMLSSKAATLEGVKIGRKEHTYKLEHFYSVMTASSESDIPNGTGICKIDGKYYYVKGGSIVSDANGLKKVLDSFVYLKNGQVQTSKSGLYQYKNNEGTYWRYVNNGIFDNQATGFAIYGNGAIYIKNGKFDKDQDGLFKHQHNKNTYYVVNSVVQKIEGIRHGKVDGDQGYWYVREGIVAKSFTGTYVEGDESKWKDQKRYYVENGKVNVRRSWVGRFGLQYVGNKYKFGGEDLEKGIDCSAFARACYASEHVKISIPRTTNEQVKMGKRVSSLSEARPGDLIFYGENGRTTHVTIYLGNNKMVHASNSKPYPEGGIKVSDVYGTPMEIRTIPELDKIIED